MNKPNYNKCKYLGAERTDIPHRGPCCVPYECHNPLCPIDIVIKSKMCWRCKYWTINQE